MQRFLRVFIRAAMVAAIAGLVVAPGASAAKKHHKKKAKPAGAIYTETNGAANAVVVFDRAANGKLKQRAIVKTGGKGGHQTQPGCDPPGGCPIVDAVHEVISTSSGLVFAVNAGSNTVTALRDTSKGLKVTDTKSSGGVFPTALTAHGNVLYVLNNNSLNISGFTFNATGKLTPIAGSTQNLSTTGDPSMVIPRDIRFDNSGKVLIATLLLPSSIDSFLLVGNVAGPAVAHKSQNPLPFAAEFDPSNHLVVAEVTSLTATGNTASYAVSATGDLTPISTQPSNGPAPCWVQITKDGRHVFVVNTGSGMAGGPPTTIARYGLDTAGMLTFSGLTNQNGNEFVRTDEILSKDSKYLYVLAPSIKAGNTSHIDEYKVGSTGGLTLIGKTPSNLAVGASGLAGR